MWLNFEPLATAAVSSSSTPPALSPSKKLRSRSIASTVAVEGAGKIDRQSEKEKAIEVAGKK